MGEPQASVEFAHQKDILAALIGGDADLAGRQAHSLLVRFGSIGAAIASCSSEQVRVIGAVAAVAQLAVLRSAVAEVLRERAHTPPVLADSDAVVRHLSFRIGHAPTEQAYAIFLDNRHRLLSEELLARGSVSQVVMHPREIIGRAIALGAAGFVLAHNHPSGDPQPSRSDLTLTRALAKAGSAVGVRLLDHIIVAGTAHCSLRQSHPEWIG